ncbi:MAG: class I SAM-dependent methyltransferase [Gemmatimonadetes bacterium]|nr:class I SAM-dependent methyltransferase [Gemmatimonadota bacterium]
MRGLLAVPRLYALWQAPFVAQKVRAFRVRNDPEAVEPVLDVGCGPGTNRTLFRSSAYLGIDLDPAYVAMARARYGDHFRVGDAAALEVADFGPVDCLFVNSLTHHLDDDAIDRLLRRTDLVRPGGRLHLIDLYLPASGISRRLALADRGQYPRPLAALRDHITRHWRIDVEERFWLQVAGLRLWAMVYFRAEPR